jgi:hypothetical protein
MELREFTYTKSGAKPSTSQRAVLVLSLPNPHLRGYDISELDPDASAEFVMECKRVHTEYLAQLNALAEAYDLKHNFRQFKPENISNTHITSI